jgi:methionyl-tRNA formyltransferase
MRIVFAGTPAFARVALEGVLAAGHEVCLVLTQPDRAAGRGMQLRPSEVKSLALERGVALDQPRSLREESAVARLATTGASAMVVAAYGLILPPAVLALFPLGCVNIHASLLPRWRGAAPIQRAILAGDAFTGISIMRMEAGLDTGPVYFEERIPIGPRDTAQSLHDRLAALGAELIVRALDALGRGALIAQPQSETGVSYAAKIAKEEAELDWSASAQELDRKVRAFNPFPVASFRLRGETVRVWEASPLPGTGGQDGVVAAVTPQGIVVDCREGALRLEVLQRAGARRLPAAQFVRGFDLRAGMRLRETR